MGKKKRPIYTSEFGAVPFVPRLQFRDKAFSVGQNRPDFTLWFFAWHRAALQIPSRLVQSSSRTSSNEPMVTAPAQAIKKKALEKPGLSSERDTGLEPATFSLGSSPGGAQPQ